MDVTPTQLGDARGGGVGAVAARAVLSGGSVMFAGLDVQLPHTISGLAVVLLLIAAIPLGWSSIRRSVARAEAVTCSKRRRSSRTAVTHLEHSSSHRRVLAGSERRVTWGTFEV